MLPDYSLRIYLDTVLVGELPDTPPQQLEYNEIYLGDEENAVEVNVDEVSC